MYGNPGAALKVSLDSSNWIQLSGLTEYYGHGDFACVISGDPLGFNTSNGTIKKIYFDLEPTSYRTP